MKLKEVKVPTLLWYGDETLNLRFPTVWNVDKYHMNGHNMPPLGDKEISSAFSRPIDSKTIREIAKTREEAVIVIDDMTRATKAYKLVPHVLKELRFGMDLGGTLYSGKRLPKKTKLIIYLMHKIQDPHLQILDPNEQIWFDDWGEVLEELEKNHGYGVRVAVFTNTEIQIPPSDTVDG